MPKSFPLAGILVAALAAAACSDSVAPSRGPQPPPTHVVITDLAMVTMGSAIEEFPVLKVSLRNEGGPGSYYLEFRRDAVAAGGAPTLASTESLNISNAFEGSQLLDPADFELSDVVTVYSRTANASQFLATDCRALHAGAHCGGTWDY
jgi:hypothetical protein